MLFDAKSRRRWTDGRHLASCDLHLKKARGRIRLIGSGSAAPLAAGGVERHNAALICLARRRAGADAVRARSCRRLAPASACPVESLMDACRGEGGRRRVLVPVSDLLKFLGVE